MDFIHVLNGFSQGTAWPCVQTGRRLRARPRRESEVLSHSKLLLLCSLLAAAGLAFLYSRVDAGPDADLPLEPLRQDEDETPVRVRPEPDGFVGGSQAPKPESVSPRKTVRAESTHPPKSRRDVERVKEARHVLESLLEIPETVAMTAKQWEEFRKTHDKALAEVQRCDLAVHQTGTRILEQRLQQGRFEEDLVTGRPLTAPKPSKPGQVVLERWMQNERDQPVRRTVRIDPGESRTLDALVSNRDSARASQKEALRAFFSRIVFQRR